MAGTPGPAVEQPESSVGVFVGWTECPRPFLSPRGLPRHLHAEPVSLAPPTLADQPRQAQLSLAQQVTALNGEGHHPRRGSRPPLPSWPVLGYVGWARDRWKARPTSISMKCPGDSWALTKGHDTPCLERTTGTLPVVSGPGAHFHGPEHAHARHTHSCHGAHPPTQATDQPLCCSTHTHTQPSGPSPQPWPCPPTCPLLGGAPVPLHITNRGPGAVTQQYGGGAIPGGERPEGPGEAYGQ